jgi:predicted DCC family thiol-disulfide oxidoreductase YuxK
MVPVGLSTVVLFAIRRDREGTLFQYAPLGGATFLERYTAEQRGSFPDSIVLRTADGRTLVKSEAAIHLGERVGGGWGGIARVLSPLPRWLLDWGYDGVAAIRRLLFKTPPDTCPTLPAELRGRFLS